MTKSELEKKLNKRSEVWIGDIQKLNRQATILGNSYQIIYFTHGERIVSIQILNLGILKLADSPDSSQGIWTRWYCEAYVEYIYSSLVRKYGNSALPLKTKVISEPDEFYKYDATFSSSNGGWLSFTGLYDRSVDGQRMRKVFGQEGACILSLTYRSPEPLGEGF